MDKQFAIGLIIGLLAGGSGVAIFYEYLSEGYKALKSDAESAKSRFDKAAKDLKG